MSETLEQLVNNQLIKRGITDSNVIRAFLNIDRKLFVPDKYKKFSYDDRPLSIGYNQTISQPYMVGLMTQNLKLDNTYKVLEIGTGCGYQTAILSILAEQIVTVETVNELYKLAESNLKKLNITNVLQLHGDGTLGVSQQAPFDRIIVTAAAPVIPGKYFEQIKIGGIIEAPVGGRYSQRLELWTKNDSLEPVLLNRGTACVFVPLIGKYGWSS